MHGVLQNIKPGNTPEKVALSLLLQLTNNFSLEQIVNRSTGEDNTLDVFTKDIETFTDRQSVIMAPISDHKMVIFSITDTSGEHKEFESITPEISKYNFNNGGHVKLRDVLKQTGIKSWEICKIVDRLMRILQGINRCCQES